MQKRNNNGGGGKMRHGRRFSNHRNNNNGGGNRGGQNDGQNIARQKHHATQMREKYSNMAKDAQMNGDHVDMEYYLQHVDHYVRVLTDIAAIEAERFAAREQHQAHADADAATGEADASTQDAQQPAAEASDAGEPQQVQPRQPRRQYANRPRHVTPDNEPNPNANTTEIPLPASVIPQIHT